MPRFDLLTEPWIPARSLDGAQREWGLLELLSEAHQVREVVDPAPPIQLGLYRFLITLVMDVFQLRTLDDLIDLLEAERFDPGQIARYVADVGVDRFDLFHEKYPFMQTPDPARAELKVKPMADLFFHLPAGSNRTHFHHGLADDHAVAPSVCARGLLAMAPFMIAGGAGYSPSINGTPPWYVLIRGRNLFETILLNTYVLEEWLLGDAPPVWRAEPLCVRKERGALSIFDGLTWQPRLIHLIPGEGGTCTYTGAPSPTLVRQMYWGPGLKFNDMASWKDPHVPYTITEKGTFGLRPQEERELWRDVGPVLLLRKDYQVRGQSRVWARPAVVDQYQQLRAEGVMKRQRDLILVDAYAMRADKAKVFEWRFERLSLDEALLAKPLAGPLLQEAMTLADDVASILRRALKVAYPREGKGNEKAFDGLVNRAQAQFWNKVHQRFQSEWLPTLTQETVEQPEVAGALQGSWRREIRGAAKSTLEEVLEPLDSTAAALQRQVNALGYFDGAVTKLLDPASKEKRGRKKG